MSSQHMKPTSRLLEPPARAWRPRQPCRPARRRPLHPPTQGQAHRRDDAVFVQPLFPRRLVPPALGREPRASSTTCTAEVFAGQTPIKALGTTDQHSQMQLYREGPNDKIITFVEVSRFASAWPSPAAWRKVDALGYLAGSTFQELIHDECLVAQYALAQSHRPTLSITLPCISPQTIGQFIYLYEVVTTYMGGLLDINTYDQPAVQLGKDATYALMGKQGYGELEQKIMAQAARDPRYVL